MNLVIFNQGTATINAHPKENMVSVEIRLFTNTCKDESTKHMILFEEAICDTLGWENCSGSVILPRGSGNYHLLNKYYHSETMYRNFKLLHREQTKYQDLRIYDTKEMGRVLCLDYMIQNSDNLTEDSYTIDLCSLVIKKEEKYNHILLIGAGDMIIPDYILRNFNVDKITLVEIDDRVIENTYKYFKFAERIDEFVKAGRLEVVVDDGAKYLKEAVGKGIKYDGVIIDNSDVYLFEGPAANLFTKEFYQNIHAGLKMGAFFSQQVSDEQVKSRWSEIVKSVGFKVLNFKYSITPEYSTALPLGSAMRD
eukprot:CAMPEP_0170525668 /NCGR_PEP_ID=MMETSP0209-20121228/11113_1 /TAXON_ID=665100 ORGANISM="Litonotus pictus, Strain P1" /NCGR_SAMPLE_ID=MMETSP0209 /ASSEMBLY_ACC=CAM_ASM_000301 /LENGTH=308 /DNA_ID=CAMNT_0010815043 /DNA_START=182 /DNA_END=1108 /DNA_ORIENTATION=+